MGTNGFSRILLSGASGLLGTALIASLKGGGTHVSRLVRGSSTQAGDVPWDPEQPLSPDAVSGFDAVIHLAGENIMGRWSSGKKELIRNSRVHGTENLARALAGAPQKPRVLIAGSAIGYYGDRGDEILREDSRSGSGFLPKVCREWEAASVPAADAGIRVVYSRTGVVLSAAGGALREMLPPFRLGLGGRLGSGNQWMSWIHIQDWVRAIQDILQNNSVQGPVNMVAPNPVTNTEFTRTLAGVLRRPALFAVPGFVLRLRFGQMAEEALLASQRVEPSKLAANGFSFQWTDLRATLESLLGRS